MPSTLKQLAQPTVPTQDPDPLGNPKAVADEDEIAYGGWPGVIEIKRECSQDALCGRLTCEVCSAPPRLRWIRQALAITKANPGQQEIATIVLPAIPPMVFGPRIMRRVFPDVLRKADFEGALVRGGIAIIWDSTYNSWILSANVLAIDIPPGAWGRLRAKRATLSWATFPLALLASC
jgi:hypothetical protein